MTDAARPATTGRRARTTERDNERPAVQANGEEQEDETTGEEVNEADPAAEEEAAPPTASNVAPPSQGAAQAAAVAAAISVRPGRHHSLGALNRVRREAHHRSRRKS